MLFCRLLVVSVALLFAAPTPKSDPAADAIAKVRAEWARDLHEKQLDKIVELYAPDAVFLLPTGDRIAGRPAIRDLTKNIMSIFTSDITLNSLVVEHSGNLAYDSGTFSETLVKVSDGSKTGSKGSYLMVFKRQADGKWLIAQQVWTGAEPAH